MIPNISACLIVKNDEKYIEGCLKSLIPVANEIIILDTGSTDKTMDICRGVCKGGFQTLPYAPEIKLFETEWHDDFSKARNECISHATGDWILSIDSDDVLSSYTQQNLLHFLETFPYKNEPVILSFKIVNPQHDNLILQSNFRSTMFNRGFGIRFKRPIHEQLFTENKSLRIIHCPLMTVFHYGNLKPSDTVESKVKRYTDKLLKLISQSKNDYYYYPYLGDAYYSSNQHEMSLEAYLKAKELFEKSGLKKNSLTYGNILMAIIRQMVSFTCKYEDAIPLINELLQISPDFQDALVHLGICYQRIGNFHEAIKIHEKAFDLLKSGKSNNPLCITSYESNIDSILKCEIARSYFAIGETEKGLINLKESFLFNPDFPYVLLNLARYYLVSGDLSETIFYLEKNKTLPISGKESLIEVSKLGKEELRYMQCLIILLKDFQKFDGWFPNELKSIQDKISDIEKKLNIENQ